MLKVNMKTVKIAELTSNLNREEWARALGLTKGSYRNKTCGDKSFTLRQILKMQELSGLPIQNFFEASNPKKGEK